MDKEILKTTLISHHHDELKDYDMYMELSNEARMAGNDELAGVLKDIASDEHVHAEVIKHFLDEGV